MSSAEFTYDKGLGRTPVYYQGMGESWPDGHVRKPDAYWEHMERRRRVPRGLQSEMSFLAHGLLLRMPQESDGDHRRRRELLQLPPFYWNSCALLGAQPYNKPCTIEAANASIQEQLAEDPSGTGDDLCAVARRVAYYSAGFGIQYLYVHRDADLDRVVIEHVPESAIIGSPVNGAPLRMLTARTEIVNGWEAVTIPQVHVFSNSTPSMLQIWEPQQQDKPEGEWVKRGPEVDMKTGIPFVPVPSGSDTITPGLLPWVVFPPMGRAAMMNYIYVNKLSDRDMQVHYAACPQTCGEKVTDSDLKKIKKASPGSIWTSTGRFYRLDFSAAQLQTSADDLASMARQLEALGNMPMVDRATGPAVTATGEIRDETRGKLQAQSFAMQWDTAWTQAAQLYEQASGIVNPSATITSDHDFGPMQANQRSADIIRADWLLDKVPDEFYFASMVELGDYPPTTEIDNLLEYQRATQRSAPRVPPTSEPRDEGADE